MLVVLLVLLVICCIAGAVVPADGRGPASAFIVCILIVLLFHLLGLI